MSEAVCHMGDVYTELGAAIDEVAKARKLVRKNRSKQVTAVTEIEQLKSTALAWIRTHRPAIGEMCPSADLKSIDVAFQRLLAATARASTRKNYADTLLEARDSLVKARDSVGIEPQAVAAPKISGDTPPDFMPLAKTLRMQEILVRRWNEIQACMTSGAHLAATVMMGGMLESLLLARINASGGHDSVFKAKNAPHDKTGAVRQLRDWNLKSMVEVGHEVRWITKSARDVGDVLRDFRNYIHPHKEYADDVVISFDDTRMFWEVTKAITRQVLDSVGRTP